MDAKEFLVAMREHCKSMKYCRNCPLDSEFEYECLFSDLPDRLMDKMIAIAKKTAPEEQKCCTSPNT